MYLVKKLAAIGPTPCGRSLALGICRAEEQQTISRYSVMFGSVNDSPDVEASGAVTMGSSGASTAGRPPLIPGDVVQMQQDIADVRAQMAGLVRV